MAVLALFSVVFVSGGDWTFLNPEAAELRWKIVIHVETQGGYALRTGSETHRGEFTGKWSWSGFLEDDEGDFLLIHAHSDVQSWTLHEDIPFNPLPSLCADEHAPEKPSLKISYILRQHNIIDIRFSINGFAVPRHGGIAPVPLPLPSSRRDPQQISIPGYDASVVKGSNRISLRSRDFTAPSAEKTFEWTWQMEDWQPFGDCSVRFESHHDAKVTVTLAPLR